MERESLRAIQAKKHREALQKHRFQQFNELDCTFMGVHVCLLLTNPDFNEALIIFIKTDDNSLSPIHNTEIILFFT